MSSSSVFHDRALRAMYDGGPQTDAQLAEAMQLSNPSSVLTELEQRQLTTCAVFDRTTRPWTWQHRLTDTGRREAIRAIDRLRDLAHLERA